MDTCWRLHPELRPPDRPLNNPWRENWAQLPMVNLVKSRIDGQIREHDPALTRGQVEALFQLLNQQKGSISTPIQATMAHTGNEQGKITT